MNVFDVDDLLEKSWVLLTSRVSNSSRFPQQITSYRLLCICSNTHFSHLLVACARHRANSHQDNFTRCRVLSITFPLGHGYRSTMSPQADRTE